MARQATRFTIYDAMEAKGVFDLNPANAQSPDFAGPVEFPKMFYHPTGARRVSVAAEIIVTPMGPKAVGEQTELISKVAKDEVEAAMLIEAGWHDHPAKAIVAGGGDAPPVSPMNRIADLEAEIRRLTAERDQARTMPEAKPARGVIDATRKRVEGPEA